MTTGYSAGAQPSGSYLAYGIEAAWGTPPAAMKLLRFTTENLIGAKTRDRPNEIDGQRSVSMAVTTAQGASGSINFVKSFSTYDDFLAGVLNGSWTANVLTDAADFTSFTIEKKVQAAQFFQYLGMYPSAMNLNVQQGAFIGGDITFVGKQELKATAPIVASPTAAPAGRVVNASSGVPLLTVGGVPLGRVSNLNLKFENQGAGEQRAVGSLAAAGVNPGLLMASAEGEIYFSGYAMYDRFIAESTEELAIRIEDIAGKGYLIKLLAPLVDAPAPGIQDKTRPIMQKLSFMGNPSLATGKTVQITRDAP